MHRLVWVRWWHKSYCRFCQSAGSHIFGNVRPMKTQISLCILAVWSESSLSAGRNFASLAFIDISSEDSDQTVNAQADWNLCWALMFKGTFSDFCRYNINVLPVSRELVSCFLGNQCRSFFLTLVMLNPDIFCFANSVDPDQLASEEANWSGSALFAIKYANL